MTRKSTFITATTVVVIFFLTFLGMRLPFLDKSAKSKLKPRAVANQLVKSASGINSSPKPHVPPDFGFLHESTKHLIPPVMAPATNVTFLTSHTASSSRRSIHGRSPPTC
jgi:hypothetical protein